MQLARGLVALLWIGGEGLEDHLLEAFRTGARHAARSGNEARAHLLEDGEVGIAGEELLAADQFPEEDAGGEDVGAAVDGQALHLLGRHIAELALEDSGLRLLQPALRLGDAEVDQLHFAFEADEDVLRADVAMDDPERPARGVALAVRVVERLAHLRDDQAGLRNRHRLLALAKALEQLAHVAAGDVLHGDVEVLVVLAELEDLHDVRVRELHRDARLVDEHGDELGVLAHGGEDFLDGEQALEPLHAKGLGDEHLGHSADGDPLEEQVFPELGRMAHGDGRWCSPSA